MSLFLAFFSNIRIHIYEIISWLWQSTVLKTIFHELIQIIFFFIFLQSYRLSQCPAERFFSAIFLLNCMLQYQFGLCKHPAASAYSGLALIILSFYVLFDRVERYRLRNISKQQILHFEAKFELTGILYSSQFSNEEKYNRRKVQNQHRRHLFVF